jgi:hypothetical protein
MRYRPNFTQWVTERFDLTDGQFVASGDRVAGLEMLSTTDMPSLGHSLGTPYPVFHSSTATDGQLYFSVYDLVHAIAYWRAGGSGVQPVAGRAIINDQTGDRMPDMVISGGNPAGLILLTLDTSIVAVAETPESDLHASLSGSLLTIRTPIATSLTVEITTTDGKLLHGGEPRPINSGVTQIDLTETLIPLASGAYYLRVRTTRSTVTVPFLR